MMIINTGRSVNVHKRNFKFTAVDAFCTATAVMPARIKAVIRSFIWFFMFRYIKSNMKYFFCKIPDNCYS